MALPFDSQPVPVQKQIARQVLAGDLTLTDCPPDKARLVLGTTPLGKVFAQAKAEKPEVASETPQKRHKYNAKRTEGPTCGGFATRIYDSKREAKRAFELEALRKAGDVLVWFCQVRLPLDCHSGQESRTYVIDFLVHWDGDRVTYEDVKGYRTDEFKRKKKAVRELYGIEIQEL